MGKTIDQLAAAGRLDDTPLPDAASGPPVDPREEPWYRFSQEIADLLEQDAYRFAEETLTAIQETVEGTRAVTVGQRRAVANIEAAVRERRSRGGGRRYEGYGRRWR